MNADELLRPRTLAKQTLRERIEEAFDTYGALSVRELQAKLPDTRKQDLSNYLNYAINVGWAVRVSRIRPITFDRRRDEHSAED